MRPLRVGCYHPQPPSPFIIIIHPKSIYTYTQCTTSIIQSGTITLGDAIKSRGWPSFFRKVPKDITRQVATRLRCGKTLNDLHTYSDAERVLNRVPTLLLTKKIQDSHDTFLRVFHSPATYKYTDKQQLRYIY